MSDSVDVVLLYDHFTVRILVGNFARLMIFINKPLDLNKSTQLGKLTECRRTIVVICNMINGVIFFLELKKQQPNFSAATSKRGTYMRMNL